MSVPNPIERPSSSSGGGGGAGGIVYSAKGISKTNGILTINPVDGTLIAFNVSIAGFCIFLVKVSFSGASGGANATISVRVDGVDYNLGLYSIINGAGGDSVSGWTLSGMIPISLAAGAHTVEVVLTNAGLPAQASAGLPLTLTVLYPVSATGTVTPVGDVINGTGSTVDAYATVADPVQASGLIGTGSIKNTDVANSLTVQETVTDKSGTTRSIETAVAFGKDYLLNPESNFDDGVLTSARPPYIEYKVEVKSTVPGSPATYEIHFVDVAPGSGQGVNSLSKYVLVAPGPLDTVTAADIPVVPGQGEAVDQADGQISVAPTGGAATADVRVINRTTGAVIVTLGTVTFPAGSLKSNLLTFTSRVITQATEALTLGNIVAGVTIPGTTMTVVVKKT